MKCPTCLYTMRCISEIHNVPGQPGRQRMDLHCFNRENDNRRLPNRCRARCHMGVITEDPKPWVCHEYGFRFYHENRDYILSSYDRVVDLSYQHRKPNPHTVLESRGAIYELPYFIPLSTNNDMHERAWELFHRLRKLVIFS
jgi:hypothetical protein